MVGWFPKFLANGGGGSFLNNFPIQGTYAPGKGGRLISAYFSVKQEPSPDVNGLSRLLENAAFSKLFLVSSVSIFMEVCMCSSWILIVCSMAYYNLRPIHFIAAGNDRSLQTIAEENNRPTDGREIRCFYENLLQQSATPSKEVCREGQF